MPQEYHFEQGEDVHIAQHRDNPLNDVRIDSEWTKEKDDDVIAPWEELIAAIVSDDITSHVDVSSQSQLGSVNFEKATQNLIESIDIIESKEHANALIECLLQEGIVDQDGEDVVLFRNVSGSAENPNYLYNWAAAMNMARSKIDDQIERAKKLDEQLNKDLEQIEGIGKEFVQEDPQEQINRVDQKLRALGENNNKVPRSPQDLPPAEENEFRQYKRTLMVAQSRKRIQENFTVDQKQENVSTEEIMQGEIQNFQELQQAFVEYERMLRKTIRFNKWNNSNVGELLDGLIDMMSGITMVDQQMEDMSPEEMDEALQEMRDHRDQAYDAGREIDEEIDDEIDEEDKVEFQDAFEK